MLSLLTVFYLALSGPPTCPGRPVHRSTFDTTKTSSLAGAYRIEFVDTTHTVSSVLPVDLVLWVNDSAHRSYPLPLRRRFLGDRVLGGTFRQEREPWVDPENEFRGVWLVQT